MSLVESLPSIFDVAPLEQGGPIARKGFLYQDHIAARFCIAMLEDQTLEEVWCEALDDITLIWRSKGKIAVEFVQVKAADISQMWSVAMICDGHDKSLIGKSLAQHRCSEPCFFRIVTRIGLQSDLKILMRHRDAQERCIGHADTCSLHRKIGHELDGVHSSVGWSPSNWLEHTFWDVAESEAAVEFHNLHQLDRWLEAEGETLFSDQREELYNRIVARVMKASALFKTHYADKKLKRAVFRAWVLAEVQRIKGHAPSKSGKNLLDKMTRAKIPQGTIDNALMLRLAYRNRSLDPKYQQEESYKTAELELTAYLNHLVAELDTEIIQNSGPVFHMTCLGVVQKIQSKYSDVELSFLQGSMYSMTDRCRHRFLKATLP